MRNSEIDMSELSLDLQRDVIAIVLGGGQGSRLRPLTTERAKPAVPLCGSYRLVDIPLSNCIHSKINSIYLLTQFNSASLHQHINNTYKFDTFSNGFVEILAADQTFQSGDWFQGTADAVRKQLRHFRNQKAKYYLILSGDQLYSMDYRSILKTHIMKGADVTIASLPVNKRDAAGFGVMHVDDDARIVNFVEKPSTEEQFNELVTPKSVFDYFDLNSEGRDYLASMGIYVFNADVLEHLLLDNPGWNDFGKHLIPESLKSQSVYAHLFSGFWEDIGTVRSYYEVSIRMVQQDPPFIFHSSDWVVYTRGRFLPGAQVWNASLTNALICQGGRINGAAISDSIVGIRSIIGANTEIQKSILMGADYYEENPNPGDIPIGIGEGTRIQGAIVDKNARIGKNVSIMPGDNMEDQVHEGWAVRDGIVVVLKNAVIPDGAVIGG